MGELETTDIYGEDIHLVEINAATIYTTIIRALETGVSEPLYPGDERRIYGEAVVAVAVAIYNSLDDAARQTLLRYARGTVLDAIGERTDTPRLIGKNATTTMRFALTVPRGANIIIPKWTKVTPDGENYFTTDEVAVLQAGAYSVDIPASAAGPGVKFNGYAPGTITTLVDLIPYIESVTNLTATVGGDDGEPYTTAGDNRYRERIRLAPAKRSTAGPETAYIYWAMTADADIVDVKAVSATETINRTLGVAAGTAYKGGAHLLPDTLKVYAHGESEPAPEDDYAASYEDDMLTIEIAGGELAGQTQLDIEIDQTREGCVKIVVLLSGGELPDADTLAKVLDAVNAADVRPLTDNVSVAAPEQVPYDINLKYYTTKANESAVVANVEGSNGAIVRYNQWQVAALGRDVNPDQLRRLILSPDWGEGLVGAIRVDVIEPAHIEVADTAVAKWSGHLTVTHEVVREVI